MTEEDFESSVKPVSIPVHTVHDVPGVPAITPQIDRINNVKQKESALHKAGVTREKAFLVVAKSLEAKKWADVIDKQGNVKQEYVDDLDKQRWAAEMVGKYFGDFVTKTEEESNGIRQLVIIRPGSETNEQQRRESVKEVKTVPRQVHLQPEDVSRDVQLMGHRQDDVIDISGNAIQRANTE